MFGHHGSLNRDLSSQLRSSRQLWRPVCEGEIADRHAEGDPDIIRSVATNVIVVKFHLRSYCTTKHALNLRRISYALL